MALTADFKRFAYEHGDIGVWQPLYLRLMRAGGIGGLSIEASNNAGSLLVSQGFAGIDNGTLAGFGAIEVTTAGTQSTLGSTANLWHALEISVSGTSVTWYLTPLAGETDESFMSLTIKGYYDAAKQGYYRIASRRVISFVFLRTALALGRIVNCESGKIGFKNIEYKYFYNSAGVLTIKYYDKLIFQIGDWNMDSTASVNISFPFNMSITATNIMRVTAIIYPDFDALGILTTYNLEVNGSGGSGYVTIYGTGVTLNRTGGGLFDTADWNKTSYNRGHVIVEYET